MKYAKAPKKVDPESGKRKTMEELIAKYEATGNVVSKWSLKQAIIHRYERKIKWWQDFQKNNPLVRDHPNSEYTVKRMKNCGEGIIYHYKKEIEKL